MPLALEKDVIIKRIDGIQAELVELHKLGQMSLEEFSNGFGFKLAHYHLHRALEGVFNIGTHVLSRLPGGQATQYSEIARKLGEFSIVDKQFAEERLVLMAKYRNRLVHFYAEIGRDEIYGIIKKDLGDFETFLSAIKRLLVEPHIFNLTID